MKKNQMQSELKSVKYDGKYTVEYEFLDEQLKMVSSAFRIDPCMGRFIRWKWETRNNKTNTLFILGLGMFIGSLTASIIMSWMV